ncbi:MAG: YbaB/EbfC family nucleoid-associated protein [Actinomycetota bacterium]|nr:YbaB/EbfC family nucleoid-associated protein [Actinomycetota bacterium]
MSGSGEMPDLNALLSQLGQVQDSLRAAQETATTQVVEGVAGGGLVRVVGTGDLQVRAVTIDPSAVDPGDVDTLQDLVLAALRGFVEAAKQLQAQAIGGVDLGGGLEGLLGG